jgi:hypothetical protein
MSAPIDITGHRFGRLVAISHISFQGWLCRCDCGNETIVQGPNLRNGNSKSCGCLRVELAISRATKHGHAKKTATYSSWQAMIKRCTNPNTWSWKHYGGRGITVCDRWRYSFENFLADMGEKPEGLTLDRINNELGYSPENCRWATPAEQFRNRARGISGKFI